ncbi:putative mitochondrial hypothetical protein [Leptomonas pyrrhocoris]|uniref:Uncharacterized protein n=1 Tax=Leptomonas pyrrhocoris TaxID=157538 RepID=A0A0N0DRS8_LEPPY|nr:putative mitochondrial hypothetical protein [Leptomonas pyrrhocoris]XP_015653338.1 putative mitochondrial hypothetical protein [Leptomonas pyrrhocoris]XP_015653339.1 putative mitochondrial hypothetical protein [Leptomonas pyrrhocoris]KPA74898.1 putative mitochondrial hypothetical protein [Leptomonas pyrrhocoris]KPA74899.1 putative mitochondrial hypothetical protein [Leptomonas pyrrhocoris]KPA74900.1 putative mitochondrial hypothetical protein [Leptomonas pyrrhocoris]|eukprot:XP_015653337.1 putative mitochondrial hypothetical protein [Leptomonas pyrrhocoris]
MVVTPGTPRFFIQRPLRCVGRVRACLRVLGVVCGEEDLRYVAQMEARACTGVLVLLGLLLLLFGTLLFLWLAPMRFETRSAGAAGVRHDSDGVIAASLDNVRHLLTAERLQHFLQRTPAAEEERRRALRNDTLPAAARDVGDLVGLARTLPEQQRVSAQLARVRAYVAAVHAHDAGVGLAELSDFLRSVPGRGAALERAASKAAGSPGVAAALAGRAAGARVRALLRGFVAAPAGQAERVGLRPFDDVAMLRYRHAWMLSEVVPRLAGRTRGGGGGGPVSAADVARGAARKAELYEAASVFNHVYYYPLRRYAAMQAFSPATVADTDAWYTEVAAGVQARFGAAQAVAALSLPLLPAARAAEVAHLREPDDMEWMPAGLRADAAVNRQTIFISLASYRDTECAPTVLDLFRAARNPYRVYVGLAQQNVAGDTPCLLPEMYGPFLCPSAGEALDAAAAAREAEARRRSLGGGDGVDFRLVHPGSDAAHFDERVCFLADHVRVRDIDARQAKGPTYGRYMAMLLYRGEAVAMVLDSHNKFRPMWDTLGASLLRRYDDPKAALSHYPQAYDPEKESKLDVYARTTAYLCKAVFHNIFAYLQLRAMVIGEADEFANNMRYNAPYVATVEEKAPVRSYRLPQPWVAGGFLLTNSTIFRDVPFDPHLPYVFDGEEVLYSARLWTHGYNIYSPPRGLCFHIYGRPKAPKVWDVTALWYAVQDRVRPRIQFFLQSHLKGRPGLIVPADTTNAYAVVDASRYGMGRQRTVAQWYDYAGVDPVAHTLDGRWCGLELP